MHVKLAGMSSVPTDNENEEQLQLTSADGTITFFDDKIEVKNLLGSKVRDVFYSKIEEVDLEKTSSAAKDVAVAIIQGADQAAADSKRLIIRTAVDEYNLDFRNESADHIKRAKDLINSKISSKGNWNITKSSS